MPCRRSQPLRYHRLDADGEPDLSRCVQIDLGRAHGLTLSVDDADLRIHSPSQTYTLRCPMGPPAQQTAQLQRWYDHLVVVIHELHERRGRERPPESAGALGASAGVSDGASLEAPSRFAAANDADELADEQVRALWWEPPRRGGRLKLFLFALLLLPTAAINLTIPSLTSVRLGGATSNKPVILSIVMATAWCAPRRVPSTLTSTATYHRTRDPCLTPSALAWCRGAVPLCANALCTGSHCWRA